MEQLIPYLVESSSLQEKPVLNLVEIVFGIYCHHLVAYHWPDFLTTQQSLNPVLFEACAHLLRAMAWELLNLNSVDRFPHYPKTHGYLVKGPEEASSLDSEASFTQTPLISHQCKAVTLALYPWAWCIHRFTHFLDPYLEVWCFSQARLIYLSYISTVQKTD